MIEQEALYEIPGTYGAVGFRERLLQMLWKDRSLWSEEMKTYSGRRLRVLQPGQWNHLEGPDFLKADIEIEGLNHFGDVELHFRVSDWFDHGHQHDDRYANVVLHAILFDPKPNEVAAKRSDGQEPETLVLAPYLKMDLEAIAELEAALFNNPGLPPGLDSLTPGQLCDHLRLQARERWQGKVAMAHMRLARLPWADYLYCGLLETLGAMRNRAAMLRLAERIAFHDFPHCSLEELKEAGGLWRYNGLRPATRPDALLQACQKLCHTVPDWPLRLQVKTAELDKNWRAEWKSVLSPIGLSIERWDTFVINHLLPALGTDPCESEAAFALWFCWPAGTMPEYCQQWIRKYLPLQLSPVRSSNGWQQAVLHCTRNQNPFK